MEEVFWPSRVEGGGAWRRAPALAAGAVLRARQVTGALNTVLIGVLVLFFIGSLPAHLLVFSVLSWICALACFRAVKLLRLSEVDQLECDQEAEAGVVSARRRNTMITVGGHAVNLLNLQLTLVDRNFSAGDYDVLLGLDDSAVTELHARETDDRIAALPVRTHHHAPAASLPLPPKALVAGPASCAMPATALATASVQQQAGAGALPAARTVLETQLPHAAAAAQTQLAALQPGRSSSSSINTAEEDEDNICAICLGGYAEGAQILELPCRHTYHAECIKPWLRLRGLHVACPVCKSCVFEGGHPG